MNPQTIVSATAAVDTAFWFILGVSLLLLVGITAVMFGFVIRYHRSRHPRPTSQAHAHLWLELTWTLIPILIVLAMFWYGWIGYLGLRNVPPGALQITATARMWSWSFTYADGRVTDKLIVPAGQPVQVRIVSEDVLHSLFIPAFRVKKDAVPGMTTYVWFLPERPGSYDLFCTEYCGLGHSSMITTVEVLPAVEYDAWYKTPPAPQAQGAGLLRRYGCLGCHSLDGSRRAGPSFKGLWGRQETVLAGAAEQTLTVDEEYLRRAILQPGAELVKGYPPAMPSFAGRLAPEELAQLLAFLKTLP